MSTSLNQNTTSNPQTVLYKLSDPLLEKLMSEMTEEHYNTYGVIIASGEINDNVYICTKGIVRTVYNKNNKVATLTFGLPGSVLIPWFSFCLNQPAFFQVEACCKNTVVKKMPRKRFLELINEDIEYAKWYISVLEFQHMIIEDKLKTINGDALGRLESLIKNAPEIVKNVPQVMIASYLDITPQYLSNIRKIMVTKDSIKE